MRRVLTNKRRKLMFLSFVAKSLQLDQTVLMKAYNTIFV